MKAPSRRDAFTLVEILVAITVFTFIMLMLTEISALVSSGWLAGAGRVNNLTKSRAMLDLIASDLQHATIRSDLPIFQVGGSFQTNEVWNATFGGFSAGTYSASFFTQVPGISTASVRTLSCVTYGIVTTTDSDKILLQRSDLAIPWINSASDVPFQGSLAPPVNNATAREIAPGVVGFEFTFRRADGTITTTYTGYNAANPVIAVGVTLAVVGNQALTQLSTANLISIQASLNNDIGSAPSITSVKTLWDSKLTSSFFAPYPKNLASNLQTFERWVVPVMPF